MDLKTLLFTVSGRVTRKTYWLSLLGLMVVTLVLEGIGWVVANPTAEDGHLSFSVGTLGTLALLVISIVMLVISVSGLLISIKRCHDRGRSGWFVLASLIPFVGAIWVLIELGFLRGTVGPNRFGPDPTGAVMPGALMA